MAARVTPDEVIAIMDTALDATAVTPYCESANVFVEATLGNSGLSESVLKEIEKWVAAHMIAITKERQTKEEGAGTAYIKYAGDWKQGLSMTSFGQMAISLDPSGTLENIAKGKGKASMYAVPSFD